MRIPRLAPALLLASLITLAAPASGAMAQGKLAFQGGPSGAANRIVTVNDDGTGRTALTDPGPGGLDEDPAWSPDGTRIAFARGVSDPVTGNFRRDIYVVDADGGNLQRLTETATDERDPDWSPDGTRIVFQRLNDGRNLWTMAADGTDATRLTAGPDNDGQPSWSPDGGRIAFRRNAVGVGDRLFVVDADGTDETQVTHEPPASDDTDPAWSPDGTRLLFNREADGEELTVLELATGAITQLTENEIMDDDPAWSPDGGRVVFRSRQCDDTGCGADDLYVMDAAPGAARTNLTNTPDDGEMAPDWWAPAGPADGDGDGITDAVDTDPSGDSAAFDDGAGTTGSIVDAGGLDVTVDDLEAPAGVRVSVGPGTGRATLLVCGFTVRLTAGSIADLTCGSVLLHAAQGQGKVVLDGGRTVVTVPAGSTARVSERPNGGHLVESRGGDVVVTTDGRSRTITEGNSATVAPAGPCRTALGGKHPQFDRLCSVVDRLLERLRGRR